MISQQRVERIVKVTWSANSFFIGKKITCFSPAIDHLPIFSAHTPLFVAVGLTFSDSPAML